MGYIPNHALAGLKNYKYKGVDKYLSLLYLIVPVYSTLFWSNQVSAVELCFEPLLELASYIVAQIGGTKYGERHTKASQDFTRAEGRCRSL